MKTEQIRVRIPAHIAEKLDVLPPSERATAVSAALTASVANLDLDELLAGIEELRRLGVLLNQSLHLAYKRGGALNEEDISNVYSIIRFINNLRGK